MPRASWNDLFGEQDRQSGHLIVAAVDQPDVAAGETRGLRGLSNLLLKLIRHLRPQSDYAMIIVRATGVPEIHLGFVHHDDADRFADVVGARSVSGFPGWESQRGFRLDAAAGLAIAAALGSNGQLDERRSKRRGLRTV